MPESGRQLQSEHLKLTQEPKTHASLFIALASAARQYGPSPRSLMRAVKAGRLPAFRPTPGARTMIFFRRDDVEKWMEASRIDPRGI